jgi:hypothetical protein
VKKQRFTYDNFGKFLPWNMPVKIIIIREKYKISSWGLLDLQFTPCGIKTNSKVPMVCKKNNLVPTVKFYPLT